MISILGLMTCFNRKEKTVRAIKNLIQGNPDIDFSFVVADDASTDGTSQALQEFFQVTVLSGNGSLFYSGGMRLAIDYAKKAGKQGKQEKIEATEAVENDEDTPVEMTDVIAKATLIRSRKSLEVVLSYLTTLENGEVVTGELTSALEKITAVIAEFDNK